MSGTGYNVFTCFSSGIVRPSLPRSAQPRMEPLGLGAKGFCLAGLATTSG
jgi:hypothetical protein